MCDLKCVNLRFYLGWVFKYIIYGDKYRIIWKRIYRIVNNDYYRKLGWERGKDEYEIF